MHLYFYAFDSSLMVMQVMEYALNLLKGDNKLLFLSLFVIFSLDFRHLLEYIHFRVTNLSTFYYLPFDQNLNEHAYQYCCTDVLLFLSPHFIYSPSICFNCMIMNNLWPLINVVNTWSIRSMLLFINFIFFLFFLPHLLKQYWNNSALFLIMPRRKYYLL